MKKNPEHKKSCTPKCWFAKRDKCECICKGKNHQRGLAMDRGSQKIVEDMKKSYEEYKKLRRKQRKQLRAGLTTKSGSSSFIYRVIGKQVKD